MTGRSVAALTRRARTLAADMRDLDAVTAAALATRTAAADGPLGDLVRALVNLRAAVEPLTAGAVEVAPAIDARERDPRADDLDRALRDAAAGREAEVVT